MNNIRMYNCITSSITILPVHNFKQKCFDNKPQNRWTSCQKHSTFTVESAKVKNPGCPSIGLYIYPYRVLATPNIPSWWLNQPIWKICSSNWIVSPGFGVKIKNVWNHHRDTVDGSEILRSPSRILGYEDVFKTLVLNSGVYRPPTSTHVNARCLKHQH